jgi:catechol 2,3-dioxygenase-like lactoylglutathione lyase family enzyme
MIKGFNGIHHISTTVPDLDKAIAFYSDLLGFEPAFRLDWTPDFTGVSTSHAIEGESAGRILLLKAGNAYLEFFEFKKPASIPQNPHRLTYECGLMHIGFDVTDLKGICEKLVAAGVQLRGKPVHEQGVSSVYILDPFGNIIELQELHPGTSFPRLFGGLIGPPSAQQAP